MAGLIRYLFPDDARRRVSLLFLGLFVFKFLWFDCVWCAGSTFRPFSDPETYIFGMLASLILTAPYAMFGLWRTTWTLVVLTGMLLLANLVYFRTYYTAIPLSSYLIASNMKDFTSSIYGSVKWVDALFPLSTAAAIAVYKFAPHKYIHAKK
jgi:hypothetical protein